MRLSSLDQFTDSLAKWDDLMTERLTEQLNRKVRINEMRTRLETLTGQLKNLMDESTRLEHLDQKEVRMRPDVEKVDFELNSACDFS
ncbi:unnamed protein product [Heterobilharzia americana]|nr:unnamed protein product [Heterobilharzia americana]